MEARARDPNVSPGLLSRQHVAHEAEVAPVRSHNWQVLEVLESQRLKDFFQALLQCKVGARPLVTLQEVRTSDYKWLRAVAKVNEHNGQFFYASRTCTLGCTWIGCTWVWVSAVLCVNLISSSCRHISFIHCVDSNRRHPDSPGSAHLCVPVLAQWLVGWLFRDDPLVPKVTHTAELGAHSQHIW